MHEKAWASSPLTVRRKQQKIFWCLDIACDHVIQHFFFVLDAKLHKDANLKEAGNELGYFQRQQMRSSPFSSIESLLTVIR